MNRRKFLQSTATLGLALASPPLIARAATKELLVAEPVHSTGYLPMYIAMANNYFAESDIAVKIVTIETGSGHTNAVLSGQAFAFIGGPEHNAFAKVKGAELRAIVACVDRGNTYICAAPAFAPTDTDWPRYFKGKAIAVSAPGSFPDMLARLALAKFNVAPSDVRLAAVGGDRDRYTALVGGVVDAAVVSNEYLPLPSSKNLKMLLEGKDALPNFLRICMFSSGKVLAQRREDAIRYLSAQSKALRYALSHRDETIALTAEATDAKPEDPRPAFVFDDAVKVGAIAPELPLPMDKLAWMQGQMIELGQIPKAGDLAKMVNTDIRAQAVERVGK